MREIDEHPLSARATAAQPVELTSDPAFAKRVIRLAMTSAVALGLICVLAAVTLETNRGIRVSLALGWVLMPTILLLSLRRPVLRYALAVPSGLVGVALLLICAGDVPNGSIARAGWTLLTAGILVGSVLGIWFWFRWLPVPDRLHPPFSSGRWALIVLHVLLMTAGIVLIAATTLP